MNLAENFLNIADQYNIQKEKEDKEKTEKINKVLKENAKIYWKNYFIPLLKEQAEKGYYKISLLFAQKDNIWDQNYYPVKHNGIDPIKQDLNYDGIKNERTRLWYSFFSIYDCPISLEELEKIIKADGFYLNIKKEDRADTRTGKYTRGYVYTYIISCKPLEEKQEININKKEKKNNNLQIPYKGPYRIEQFLISHRILYDKEFCFPECKYQKPLPFDFIIYDKKQRINCLIEFDGKEHFEYVEHWHKTPEGFKEQQLRDKIKNSFCEVNNIKLIRISYTEYDNIEEILTKNLLN